VPAPACERELFSAGMRIDTGVGAPFSIIG
jgi:hypothetical protein